MPQSNLSYLLHLADNNLILGQRLGAWCGHGPVLEQDIALTNIALDLIGQSRLLFQYAALIDGNTDEDTLAFLRLEQQYLNLLLVEQPNGNFGDTIVRQYFYDVFHYLCYESLTSCTDPTVQAISQKALKEIAYHKRWSGEWLIRLGDGTPESHQKMQDAVNHLWQYTGEMFVPAVYEIDAHNQIQAPDVSAFRKTWNELVSHTLETATLQVPAPETWMQSGGKQGIHTEHMGYLLTEMQFMQRTFPAMQW